MPNRLHNPIKQGGPKRDESIARVIGMFPIMRKMGITTVCTNFMAYVGWCRTRYDIRERGGALVTGFDRAEYRQQGDFSIGEAELWANLSYFLRAAVPEAQRHGIRIALHPDDPPVARLGEVARILTSVENFDRALAIAPGDSLGVTLCQGSFAAMGEDIPAVIRHFGDAGRIFFAHFRDIDGTRERFRETFHDNGQTDMAAAVRAYRACGYAGPIRVDHVPTMYGEENARPGYANIGRLYALGYLKGLMDASGFGAAEGRKERP